MSNASGLTEPLPGVPDSRGSVRALAVWAAILVAGCLPLLIRFGMEQWARPQYQFFPLMLLAAAYLAWQRLGELPAGRVVCGSQRVTGVLLGVALVLMLAASALWSGRLAAVSAWLALAGLAWHMGGWLVIGAVMPSAILLALVIGPPVGVDEPLLQTLRELIVWISSGVLIWLDVPHMVTGTVIEIPTSRLLVAEACSGINSLMAVLGCTLVLGFSLRRSAGVVLLLLAAGVLFVSWANIVRIAGGAWLKATSDIDILSGSAHEYSSIVLFAVCMGLVISVDAGISMLAAWRKPEWTGDPDPVETPVETPRGPTWTANVPASVRVFAIVFALIGLIQVGNVLARGGPGVWLSESGASHLRAKATFTVPQEVGGWKRSEDADKLIAQPEIEGKQSHVWAYRQGNMVAIVAIDYPFAGFHDLTVCYRNAGWTIQKSTVKMEQEATQQGCYTTVDIARVNEWGTLYFAAVGEDGQWATPPKLTASERLKDRLGHMGRPDWNACTYQVQAWVHAYEPITEPQQAQLGELFLAVRGALSQQVVAQLDTKR